MPESGAKVVQTMIEKTVSAEIEIREVAGRKRLEGTLIQEGRVGRVRAEVFAPNSIRWPGEGVGILVEHRSQPEVLAMPVRLPDGRIQVSTRATEKMIQAVEGGKNGMSIEFHALQEHRNRSNVREIQSALVVNAALVANPEYGQGKAELRQQKRRRIWL